MGDSDVIVADRQTVPNLDWMPGLTDPNEAAIRQIYEDGTRACVITQNVDAHLVADSVDTGLIWMGFCIGLVPAVLAILITQQFRRKPA